jgi:hypothetical protein
MPFIHGIEGLVAGLFGDAVGKIGQHQTHPLMRSGLMWAGQVVNNLVARYGSISMSGVRCGLRPRGADGQYAQCPDPAIGVCGFCQTVTCLNHAFVDRNANIICPMCIARAQKALNIDPNQQHSAPPPPPPHEHAGPAAEDVQEVRRKRLAALKALGLKDPLEEGELEQAFRSLMKASHPDRSSDEKDRQRREKKCAGYTAAYHYVKEHPKVRARSAA